jgi:hypothetical protein
MPQFNQYPAPILPLTGSEQLMLAQTQGSSGVVTVTATVADLLAAPVQLSSPPPIGNVAPNTGAFTTLSATSTISGAGFTAWLASPPPIGATAPNTGAFSTLSATSATVATLAATGTATAPTPAAGDDSTKVATTAFLASYIANASAATVPLNSTDLVLVDQGGVQKSVTVANFLSYLATSLPTTLPASSGVLWNNGGVVSIS